MYICICQAVTDHEIREAVAAGATDLHQLADCTGSGTCCGRCHSEIEQLIQDHRSESGELTA